MTLGIKNLKVAALVFAGAVWFTSAAWAAGGIHPDGPSTTYRGWGPSVPTPDGYVCTLFDSLGVRVGSVQFHSDGRIDLTVGTEQAHFVAHTAGITDFHDLDTAAFPSIPNQFKSKDGYRLMTFTGRFQVGANVAVAQPVTDLAKTTSVVEARCVYVVDSEGNVVFCLNCIFAMS
jgi:hypothetical protein